MRRVRLTASPKRAEIDLMERDRCPICRGDVMPHDRYPRRLCDACSERAADENGRKLTFFNVDTRGGFLAQYLDTGEVRDNHVCYVDGVKCWADEADFGGIVLIGMEEDPG